MTERGLLAESWRGRLSWHPFTEVTVIAEKHVQRVGYVDRWLWALDDCGEPYTLRADCVERINPSGLRFQLSDDERERLVQQATRVPGDCVHLDGSSPFDCSCCLARRRIAAAELERRAVMSDL